ncbi:PP2C family protein-serine/threonine phosphatase [Clostridium sp. ZS2-4]|uniref:PP2C family protein-serine/threonine phosphatase n=1 Tax=Clostridium sp. ZS2-4 TaxID=2987703 RepID=UPI00227D63C6|nr:protein phosphatase [Clostridium sp. ZS2-4]MCY6355726.1 protein phosphatase [Clostridium sp. ZS2-4]
MLKFIHEKYYIFILALVILLSILLILRNLLIKKIKRPSIQIENGTTIGKEEIQENYLDIVYSPHGILTVLADGIGKNEAGRISSIVAVKTFTSLFSELGIGQKIEYFFKRAFNIASSEILKRVDNNQGGASVVSAIVIDNLLYYGLAGNTMIAVYRKGELFKLSEGHTVNVLAKKEFYKGKITKEHALAALKEERLLHYVGQEGFNDIEMFEKPVILQQGDIVVLMNKGVYDCLKWVQLEQIIIKNRKFEHLSNEIIEAIKKTKKQNKYNASIILMKYVGN